MSDRHEMRIRDARNRSFLSPLSVAKMPDNNRARTKGTTMNKLCTRGVYACTYVRRCLREIDGAWDERVSSLQKNPRAPSARNSANLLLLGCRLLIMRASDTRCLLTVNAREAWVLRVCMYMVRFGKGASLPATKETLLLKLPN